MSFPHKTDCREIKDMQDFLKDNQNIDSFRYYIPNLWSKRKVTITQETLSWHSNCFC